MIPPAAYMFMTGPYVPAPNPRPWTSPSVSVSVAPSGPTSHLYASVTLSQETPGPVAFDFKVGEQAPRLWYVGADGSWAGEVPLVREGDGSVPAQTVYVPSYLASISFWDSPDAPVGCTAAVYAGASTAVLFGGADHALTGLRSATVGAAGQLRRSMFMNCTSLASVLTSGGFSTVPASAFEGCASLASCPLPDNSLPGDISLELSARCFYGCASMPGNSRTAGQISAYRCGVIAEDCLAGCNGIDKVYMEQMSFGPREGDTLTDAAERSGLAKPSQGGVVSAVQSRAGVMFQQSFDTGYSGYKPVPVKVQFDGSQWTVLESRAN